MIAAARRVSTTLHAEPVPVDLCGDPVTFAIDHEHTVGIRAMGKGDIADLARWRSSAHVSRWWPGRESVSEETVEAAYGPDIDGLTSCRLWVAEVNGRSIGFVRDFLVGDHVEFADVAPAGARGVDYALGEVSWTGQGLGGRILWAWMLKTHHRLPEVRTFFAAPDHRNGASLRVLAKLGFRQGTWFDEPASDGLPRTLVACLLDVERVLG